MHIIKIVGFEVNGEARLGLLEGEDVVDLTTADSSIVGLADVLGRSGSDLGLLAMTAKASRVRHRVGQVKFTLPVTKPGKIICLGLNYLEHAREGGHKMPAALDLYALRDLAGRAPAADHPSAQFDHARI